MKRVIKNYQIYKDPISQFIGLRFSKRSNNVLIFELNKESRMGASIDMLFVFYPINVVWLDKNKKIVDIKKNLKPFTPLIIPRKKAKYILEFTNPISMKIGDTIKF
ncbi:MAG: DUF192 domain-containing protein [Candidatus Nanoarchaeia archaeon]|jgi:hypothetical protein|nr:DUF192 domain-containing protein [Candidatus Nanoarchaeia archaeon]|tara:strand:- start:51355 stop:51672 length:318 start_codon:yes stop_codon:yes gene_type:complete